MIFGYFIYLNKQVDKKIRDIRDPELNDSYNIIAITILRAAKLTPWLYVVW